MTHVVRDEGRVTPALWDLWTLHPTRIGGEPAGAVSVTPVRGLVAPDKFAGTRSAVEAAAAIAEGWRRTAPDDVVVQVPLADGGPGFLDVLHASLGGELLELEVGGPLGEPVPAAVLLVGTTAYVESAQACGLHLVPAARRSEIRCVERSACARNGSMCLPSSTGSPAWPP